MQKINSICLIDDDDIYQFTTRRTLELTQRIKSILVFSNGKEAMNFFEENVDNTATLPDIIFLDLNMPIMDGWQFLEKYIRLKPGIHKKIIIYIVTSSIDIKDVMQAKSISEVSDYIIKPMSVERFNDVINILENDSPAD